MPAPPGNQYGLGHGRPRRLATELQRLRDAAQHVDALLEQHALCDALMGRTKPTPSPPELLRAKASLREEVAEVEAAAELVERIMGDGLPGNDGRRRRKALGADAYEQAILQAGRALDRLIPDNTELPQ